MILNFTRAVLSLAICPLMITCALHAGCGKATPAPTPSLPAPTSQPDKPQQEIIRLKTAIIDGPSGTVENTTVTFKWGSALSSVDPSTLKYATYLQGYDGDYTPFLTGMSRTFSNLPPKSYIFYVKAKDAEGNIEPEPASRSFTIFSAPVIIHVNKSAPETAGHSLTLIGSDINRMVISGDGSTLYALSSLQGKLYRSDSAGRNWTDISAKVSGMAPWIDIAVSPDNPHMVAVITDAGREVYISADAGLSFNSTGLSSAIGAGCAACCISISPDYGSPKCEIAAGIINGTGAGKVMANILSSFPSGWFDTGAPAADIFAIQHSRSFADDGAVVAIASTATKTYLFMGIREPGAMTTNWNPIAGYPVELGQPGSGSPGTPLNYADIALPSDFNAGLPYSRHVFASWGKSHPGQDVYHVFDTQAYRMNAPEPIASLAYYGSSRSGKLLLGAVRCKNTGGGCYMVQTYFAQNPLASMPSAPAWQPSQKAPTGSRGAQVIWSADGNTAFAGTSGTEAAISHSNDNGYTWNQ